MKTQIQLSPGLVQMIKRDQQRTGTLVDQQEYQQKFTLGQVNAQWASLEYLKRLETAEILRTYGF